MTTRWLLALGLCYLTCARPIAQSQEIDGELSRVADRLAKEVRDNGKKKVTVIDFTDLQGNGSELGRYVAEQLTVDLVISKQGYSVLDRANLKTILAEHKLTATGLVDPENAKKLGQFAGVDAIILGTLVPKDQKAVLTAKIITTDTAEIVGAVKGEFQLDETVQKLRSQSASEFRIGVSEKQRGGQIKATKSFGDLRVDVLGLEVLHGTQFVLNLDLSNQGKRTLWVAASSELMGIIKARLTDSAGSEFRPEPTSLSGLQAAPFVRYGYVPNSFSPATELKPNESTTASLKFTSMDQKPATAGGCHLQLELLVGRSYSTAATGVTTHNFVQEIETN